MNTQNSANETRKYHWFQFNLKSLLLFALVLGSGSGIVLRWFLRELSIFEEITHFRSKNAKDGKWLVRVTGNEMDLVRNEVNTVREGRFLKEVDDKDLAEISKLRCLRSVRFYYCRISKEGLMKLKDAENLELLVFDRSDFDLDVLEQLNKSRSRKIYYFYLDPPPFVPE